MRDADVPPEQASTSRSMLRCTASFGQQLVAGESYPFLDNDARRDRARVIDFG